MSDNSMDNDARLMSHTLVLGMVMSKCFESEEMAALHRMLTEQVTSTLSDKEPQERAARSEVVANNELDKIFAIAVSMKK